MVTFADAPCPVCSGLENRPARLRFDCPVCGRAMRELVVGEPETVFHCPGHCSTLVPNNDMLKAARAEATP